VDELSTTTSEDSSQEGGQDAEGGVASSLGIGNSLRSILR
jgi:hypothetical protein